MAADAVGRQQGLDGSFVSEIDRSGRRSVAIARSRARYRSRCERTGFFRLFGLETGRYEEYDRRDGDDSGSGVLDSDHIQLMLQSLVARFVLPAMPRGLLIDSDNFCQNLKSLVGVPLRVS